MLRRNVGIKVLLFNNKIYASQGPIFPDSELNKKKRNQRPFGSVEPSLQSVSLAIGSEATFVARSVDVFQSHLKDTLRHAAAHKARAYVEILQKLQHLQRWRVVQTLTSAMPAANTCSSSNTAIR